MIDLNKVRMAGVEAMEKTAVNNLQEMGLDNTPLDNNKQAVDIKGYRVLTQDEKDRMNALKELEQHILEVLDDNKDCIEDINKRSLLLAKEHIQTGFMWAVRAIARPNGE